MVKYKMVFYGAFLVLLGFTPLDNTIQNPQKDKFVVVLDAGHGGKDPGNRGNGYKEKDIALKVILDIGKRLENDDRFKVVYTRKSDKFIELYERGNIANKANADLFVSVHCNAHNSQASGTETFVLGLHANKENFNIAKKENQVILLEDNYEAKYDGFDPNSPESIIGLTLMQEEYLDQSLTLASFVQEKFKKPLRRKSRGVKQAGFIVLHQTFMPSVLIELGFLTNDEEGKYLNSKKGQKEMAESIFKSVVAYKESLDTIYNEDEEVIMEMDLEESDQPTQKEVTENIAKISKMPKVIYEDIVFKVQLAAGSKEIEAVPSNFNGLDAISSLKIGDLYKYFHGETSDYTAIKMAREIAKQKGYTECFVVAFKNGSIIPMIEALKSTMTMQSN